MICKAIPAYLPHELLGYERNSLNGMLLTFEIVSNLNMKEHSKSKGEKGRMSRMAKFRRNR